MASSACEAFAPLPESEISQVRLMPVAEPCSDDSEERFALDEPQAARELLDPPLDFSEFIGQRWGLRVDVAEALLCDWLRDYRPQHDYSAALATAAR